MLNGHAEMSLDARMKTQRLLPSASSSTLPMLNSA
jgi:hypothetical protein